MSRSGYSDDLDTWALVRWRGAVKSALRGSRGQQFLKEALAAFDAMPEKRLASESLVNDDGDFCTLGIVGHVRGIDLGLIDPEDYEYVSRVFGISEAMAREIVYLNDEAISDTKYIDVEICGPLRPYEYRMRAACVPNDGADFKRWEYMRNWIASNIIKDQSDSQHGAG